MFLNKKIHSKFLFGISDQEFHLLGTLNGLFCFVLDIIYKNTKNSSKIG